MPNATITSTASTFGTISGTFAADQSTVTGTVSGIITGTLDGSVGVPGPAGPTGSQGPQGDPGASGVVNAIAPIFYDSGTQTVSIDNQPTFEAVHLGSGFGGIGELEVFVGDGFLSNSLSMGGGLVMQAGPGIFFPDVTQQTTAFPGFAGYATLSSPTFTGNPTAPTPATPDNDTSIATTAFVKAQGYLTTGTAATTYLPLAGGAMDANASITASDTSTATDSELAGWGLGVQLSADNTQGTTVEFDGLDAYDGASHMQVTPTGLTFPDATVQTTAWVGNLGDYRTLTDYDFTNVADTKLTTYGLTVLPNAPDDPNVFDSFVNATEVRQSYDVSEGGTVEGQQIYASYKYDGLLFKRQDWINGPEGPPAEASLLSGVKLGATGLTFINWNETTRGSTVQYLSTGITFGNASVQTIAFPGFNNTALTGNPTAPTPATSDNDTSIATTAYVKAQAFGDRYLSSSTTSNTINNGNKTFTIGTGLSYTPTQNLTISYDAGNHMHGEVLTYNSGTGVLTVDIKNHTGSGTYASWVVNVGGITPATSVAFADITGAVSGNTNLQAALDLKANLASPTFTGTPLSTTAAVDTNTTQIATTAYVVGQAYAKLASPTFSGTPSLPTGTTAVTQTAGNNTTALATTAFVTAAVPAFATNAQAKTGTSTTLAINPASMRSNDLNPRAWQLNRASFGTAVVGTGAAVQLGGMICYLDAGSVSLNSALCRVQSNNDASFHLYGTSTNGNASFSDKLFMSGRCGTYTVSDAAKTVMISFGKTLSSGAGSLATKGVGLKHVGGASTPLLLTVHNGTTLTDVSSSYTPVNLGAFDWEIYSDGAGNVTLTVNGTQVASTALGPTGACATAQITYQEEIFFTATPALSYNNRLISARGKLIFGP